MVIRSKSMLTLGMAVLFASSACGGSSSTASSSAESSKASCPPSTSDAYAKAVLADNPVGYYRLDDASGAKLCDASTRRNDGAFSPSGVTYDQPGALKGISDTSIRADGTVNPATSTGNSALFGSTDFTLEAWFKTTSKQDQILVDVGQGGAGRIAGIGPSSTTPGNTLCGGYLNAVGFDTYDGYVTADASSLGINVFDGKWHYLVGSYSQAGGGSLNLYLDGRLAKSASIHVQPATSPVRVGYWIDSVCNSPFAGSLDEVALYTTALTPARVKAHYSASGH